MNADEARKCVAVARRLLDQTESWISRGDALETLGRATKYAEKGLRLDPDAVGTDARALIGAIAARKADVEAGRGRGGADPSKPTNGTNHGSNGDEGPRRRAGTSAKAPSPSAKPQEQVKGTPEQEALMARVRRANDDYYKILGIEKGAGDDEIKKAYRKTALKLHPDKCQANGADEAFKQVSRAFACLSDTDKRAAYDRYGTEDPNSRQSPFSSRAAQHRGGGMGRHTYYQGEEVDPAEIFNMFFGGGFPGGGGFGPGARFRTQRGGSYYRANRAYQDGRRGHPGGAGSGQARQENTDDIFRNLFQLLPIMIVFLMYFLSPGEEQNFALNRTPTFSQQLKTSRHEFPFYVRNVREWTQTYPESTSQRRRMEHNIEMTHINHLESNCLYERQQQQRLYRFGTRAERERAREMTMASCDKLHDIRVKQSNERLNAGKHNAGKRMA